MQAKQIIFTAPNTAELLDSQIGEPGEDEVIVKIAYTTISNGTEKANLIGDLNVYGGTPLAVSSARPQFPRYLGYSGAGVVYKTGAKVTSVKVNDRVAVLFGKHSSYCKVKASRVVKLPSDDITLSEASMATITTFPVAALRKTQPEIGESVIIMGLGILGQFAVQFAKAMGLVPVIAVDPVEDRRNFALSIGADFALDPLAPEFAATVKKLTGGGAHIAIEVTGRGEGLDMALDCMRRQGRVALLGCTRDSNFTIDYYRKVHYPGITLVGAHTSARPEYESYPHYWNYRDEVSAVFKLLEFGRINFKKMISEIHTPDEAPEVFRRLATEKDFPFGVQFDWTKM